MIDAFQRRKKDILSKQDKSSKGDWDKKIVGLCEKLNKNENYYTTSSCAGRVVIMVDKDKKGPGLFEFVSHDLISFNGLKKELNNINKGEMMKFKQEPPIIHVACETLENANEFCEKARKIGWRRTGIIATGKRFIVEAVSTEKLEFPVIDHGETLVSDDFLELIVKKANGNLKKGWDKIEKLKKLI